ncbi:MAG: phospholipid carrier-dependent glycosyltransferase, partial [Kofleriaceae bacterium]
NAAAGNFPPQHYLVAGRLAIALFGSACLVLVYICAVQLLRRRWEPLVAPVVLFGTAAFQVHASHVFTDMPQIAFLLAAVAALQSFIASGRRWMFFLALSFIGLSCAVKFSTAPVVVAAMIVFVGARGTIVRRVGRLLAIAIIPFAVFVVVNPYLYPAPITRSLELVERWSATKRAQQSMPSIANQAVTSPIQRVALVTARGVLVPKAVWPLLPLGLVVGLAILAFLIQTGRSELARRPCTIVVASGVAAVLAANVLDGPALLLPLLAGAGAVELVLRVKARDGVWTHYAAVLAVFLIFTALWLPFDWSRYYLPVIALMSVVYAAGVARIVEVTSWT